MIKRVRFINGCMLVFISMLASCSLDNTPTKPIVSYDESCFPLPRHGAGQHQQTGFRDFNAGGGQQPADIPRAAPLIHPETPAAPAQGFCRIRRISA